MSTAEVAPVSRPPRAAARCSSAGSGVAPSGRGCGCCGRSCRLSSGGGATGPCSPWSWRSRSCSGSRCGWPCRGAAAAGRAGLGAAFLTQVAGNGVFLAFLSLTIMLTLVLPLVVAVVSGESLAGEASMGTLRYLLAVPAGRARLLSVKYTAVVMFALAACLLVAASALIMGVALFPVGPVTLLSGNTVPLAEGLLKLLFVVLLRRRGHGHARRHRAGDLQPHRAPHRRDRGDHDPRGGQRGMRQHPAVRGRRARTCPRTGGCRSTRCCAPRSTRRNCCTGCCRSACTS